MRYCLNCSSVIARGSRCKGCENRRKSQYYPAHNAARGGSGYAWGKIRERVLARDGKRCLSCGSVTRLEVDHILPLSGGGTNELENLVTLCHECHLVKTRAERANRPPSRGNSIC